MTLAERIVVLSGGNIMQVGTPDQIYNEPVSKFVAGFTGSPPMNFLGAKVARNGSGQTEIVLGSARLALPLERQAACGKLDGRAVDSASVEDITLEAAGSGAPAPSGPRQSWWWSSRWARKRSSSSSAKAAN